MFHHPAWAVSGYRGSPTARETPKSSQPNPDLLGHLVMETLSEIIYLLVSEGSASSCETHRISFLAWLPFSVKPWHVHLAYSSSRVTPPVPPGRRPSSWPLPWLTWPSWETVTLPWPVSHPVLKTWHRAINAIVWFVSFAYQEFTK